MFGARSRRWGRRISRPQSADEGAQPQDARDEQAQAPPLARAALAERLAPVRVCACAVCWLHAVNHEREVDEGWQGRVQLQHRLYSGKGVGRARRLSAQCQHA